MVALMQRFGVAVALLAACGWCAWCWHRGLGPGAYGFGLVLALAPQAPVLALEFLLLASLGRDPSMARPGAGSLLRAWASEVITAWQVFGWRQPFAADRAPDLPGQPGRVGVLMLHGYGCNRGLWTPWLQRLRQLGVPCTALTLEPAFGRIERCLPAVEAAVLDLMRQSGRAPLLVGHSMGGLVARAWLAAQADSPAADARVLGVVTIATPHHGTWLARFGVGPNARQMRPGSAWLAALAARETPQRLARFTCFYSHADNLVMPARSAMLEGADNRHLDGVAHVQMLFEPMVFGEVLRRVGAGSPDLIER